MKPPLRQGIGARPIRVSEPGIARDLVTAFVPASPSEVGAAFVRGDIVWADGVAVEPDECVQAGDVLWAFAAAPDEPEEPIRLEVVAQTDRWMVVDKPHGMATMPRGSHVASTVTVAARRQFGNDEIVAAHRLDEPTAGLILLTLGERWRRPYQMMFERRAVIKTYLAVANDSLAGFRRVELCLAKERGSLQTRVVAGEPNSITEISLVESHDGCGLYRIHPLTGRTHQIRVTMAHLGAPIMGDVLYPRVVAESDFEDNAGGFPLQLLAAELAFIDPVDGHQVTMMSRRVLASWQ